MTRKTLFLAVALALPATGAFAQNVNSGVSWSYFDFGYQRVAPDDSALDDSNGFGIRGSGAINENWHVFLGWNRSQLDGSDGFTAEGGVPGVLRVDEDFDRFNIGIGYNLPIATNTDLFTRVGYERAGSADFDIVVGDQVTRAKLDSTDGYSVEVGLRSAFTARFEAGASVRYIAFDDPEVRIGDQRVDTAAVVTDDSTTSLLLYGQYKFGNGWGVVAEADINSEYNALFLGGRLSY